MINRKWVAVTERLRVHLVSQLDTDRRWGCRYGGVRGEETKRGGEWRWERMFLEKEDKRLCLWKKWSNTNLRVNEKQVTCQRWISIAGAARVKISAFRELKFRDTKFSGVKAVVGQHSDWRLNRPHEVQWVYKCVHGGREQKQTVLGHSRAAGMWPCVNVFTFTGRKPSN